MSAAASIGCTLPADIAWMGPSTRIQGFNYRQCREVVGAGDTQAHIHITQLWYFRQGQQRDQGSWTHASPIPAAQPHPAKHSGCLPLLCHVRPATRRARTGRVSHSGAPTRQGVSVSRTAKGCMLQAWVRSESVGTRCGWWLGLGPPTPQPRTMVGQTASQPRRVKNTKLNASPQGGGPWLLCQGVSHVCKPQATYV